MLIGPWLHLSVTFFQAGWTYSLLEKPLILLSGCAVIKVNMNFELSSNCLNIRR